MHSLARLSSLALATGHSFSTKLCFSLFLLGVLLLSPSSWGFDPFGGPNLPNPFVSHTNDLEDPDGDGFPNAWETHYGTDPQSATSFPDPSHYAIVDASATGWGVGSPSSPYATIQEAIDQAPFSFGIILVEEGTYPDSFSLFGKSLLIRSRSGAVRTILTQSGFSIDQSTGVVLDGFTLKNFTPTAPDSPLWVGASEGAFVNCIFEETTTPTLFTFWSQPGIQFRNCLFRNNTPSDPNSFLFSCFAFTSLNFLNCTFIDNSGSLYIGMIGSSLTLRQSIFWRNGSPSFVSSFPGTQLTIEDSCVEGGYLGTGNQSSDPLVLSTGFLEPGSPYIGSGTPLVENPIDLSRRLRTTNDWGAFDHQDSDNDGIYDSWEILHYGTLDQVGTSLLQGTWEQLGVDIDGEAAGDKSGRSVSLSADGQTVAIGAYYNDGGGTNSGHVRIYQWNGGAWQQLGGDIDGEATGDWSGDSVSLSADGQTVAIGAYYNDGGGDRSGHVRIYQWDGSAWQQLGGDIDGEAAGDWSGNSVSLSADGQTVAIGAHYNYGGGFESGHVRIYQWNGSAWQQLGGDIDGEATYDTSGDSVSLSADGQTVAIGASGNDGGGDHSGHVRIYQWDGSAWQQRGVDIDGEAAMDFSGYSLSLSADGQSVAIGAPANDGGGQTAGHVRVYQWDGSAWQQMGIDIDGEAAGDQSAFSVSLSADGQTVAIGAIKNDGGGNLSGHVRIYQWDGSAWQQLGVDIDGEAAGDLSGWSVSLSADGKTVAIGAPWNDGGGNGAGHVRVYSLSAD